MRCLAAIPVFNESRYLAGILNTVRGQISDVLVIDDGSTDDTPRVLAATPGIHVIRHGANQGYGQSLIDAFGFAAAQRYDWVITLDCDEQHEPGWIPCFIAEARRDDADVISGSRYLEHLAGNSRPPADRRRINCVITEILNSVLGLSLTDSFCGYKAHRVEAMRRLRLSVPGYAFPLQFWTQAARTGLRIREIPVPLIYNDPSRHFGETLNDPDVRLRHYLDVLSESLAEAGMPGTVADPQRGGQRCA
ncbi:MAG: glycosyltransferase family 2 protein [Phycisphaerae bacterium]|nr:glycosyltransferase family 2 protein [Phycisphaerae bacterium]NUQ46631.1 glycosyltransferase family 2 protein [Phycisphaerae bacterium]